MKVTITYPQYRYTCDICGKEIQTGPYQTQLVTLSYETIFSNGWNETTQHHEKHAHKKCLAKFIDLA